MHHEDSTHNDQTSAPSENRRQFMQNLALGVGTGIGLTTIGCQGAPDDAAPKESGQRKLKAAFSNAGLQSTWCTLGKQTAELWGKLLNVDIEWLDGEMDPEKQRNKIDSITHLDWDFCCFQAVQIDSLAAPVRKMRQRGIPVISMDTLLVSMDKMRETGVWSEVTPNHVEMAEKSVQYMVDKIGGKGKVIHIGGLSAHSGAVGRRQGFENIVSQHPDIEVVGGGVRWCDWKKEKARNTFEAMLKQQTEPIAGAFFHSDDMALASALAVKDTIHKDMVIVAVDGQREGLDAVKEGVLAATTVNPVCRIHRTALTIGQFIARNQEDVQDVPLEIITPGPLVTNDDPNVLNAMYYMADPAHCLI